MRQQSGHYHAQTLYEATGWRHFVYLWWSLLAARLLSAKSLTVHLPLEIQHPKIFKKPEWGNSLIGFGEFWKKVFLVRLYWENAPLLESGSWKLKYGQSSWHFIPKTIDLCLDTGHLIQGSRNMSVARKRIGTVLKKHGLKIKHLHLHENDLVHDDHWRPKKILSKQLLGRLKSGRTFIYERG